MPPMVPKLPDGPHFGLLARFKTTKELFHACEKVRDAGFSRWDAHTPFPIHGLEKAMGLPASKLAFISLVTGLSGAGGGMLLQWWVSTQAYPLVISGKPFFSWPAFIPVTFELGILFAALGAVLGMFGINQLPMHNHPLFNSEDFESFSDDAFFISIESWDPKFDATETSDFLKQIGAERVELIESES
jgi:hypothetical protein